MCWCAMLANSETLWCEIRVASKLSGKKDVAKGKQEYPKSNLSSHG